MKLSDVRAVISGAGSGLGREFCLQALQAGARVFAGDVNIAALRDLKRQTSGSLLVQSLDVTDEAGVCSFVCQASSALENVNVLINCAGILRDGLLVSHPEDGEIRKMSTSQWTRVLDVNLTGSFYLSREVAAAMLARKSTGVIINISSLCRSGHGGQSNYSASKAAIDAATRSWAKELGPFGIRVAAIAPGVVNTPFLKEISEQALERLKSNIALGRIGHPSEIWQAVRFIIECEYFTGRVLEVDGGADLGAAA
jgi:3-oxoacyl-[acyl-carrier protein] reductase